MGIARELSATGMVAFDPTAVDLMSVDPRDVICYLTYEANKEIGDNQNDDQTARYSAILVIFLFSTIPTLFPVIAKKCEQVKMPLYGYMFMRCFGSGVIIATAFIHLLDPAYSKIGPQTCVGMTGAWSSFSWPPCMLMFLLEFMLHSNTCSQSEGVITHEHDDIEGSTLVQVQHNFSRSLLSADEFSYSRNGEKESSLLLRSDADTYNSFSTCSCLDHNPEETSKETLEEDIKQIFRNDIPSFLVLEFGVIFHSMIIGINLGASGEEFSTLFPVLTLHQIFEGLGLGAKLSSIPVPHQYRFLPWALCVLFGITTSSGMIIGLLLRSSYSEGTFASDALSGVLDSTSAGILLYAGFVGFLAQDFLFKPYHLEDKGMTSFGIASVFLGVALMALLGKWA